MKRIVFTITCCIASLLLGCTGGSSTHAGGTGLIVVDGDPSDWVNTKPIMVDSQGDSTQVAGSDVTAVWILSDAEYVYIRLDLANGTPADNMQIAVSFAQAPDERYGGHLASIYTAPNTSGVYRDDPGQNPYLGSMEYIIGNGIIEIAVKREVLNASAVSYVKFWTQLLSETSLLDRPDGGEVEYVF